MQDAGLNAEFQGSGVSSKQHLPQCIGMEAKIPTEMDRLSHFYFAVGVVRRFHSHRHPHDAFHHRYLTIFKGFPEWSVVQACCYPETLFLHHGSK
jgi:hypothetical protein